MIRSLVGLIVGFARWLFGPRAAGLDVALGLQGAFWGGLMVLRPTYFDTERFAGFAWLPDGVWITFMTVLVTLHLAAVLLPERRNLRVGAALLSSWLWTFVAISLGRVEFSPGVANYGIVGIGALFGAIHVGLSPSRG